MSESIDPRSRSELRALLRAIEEGGWEYARVEIDGAVLTVASDPQFAALDPATGSAQAPAPAAPPAAAAAAPSTTAAAPAAPAEAPYLEEPSGTAVSLVPDDRHARHAAPGAAPGSDAPTVEVETVTAPSIGLFWRSPKPGAPPFVEVGDHVAASDTVCIIEVMKLMTQVSAGVAGVVQAIHVGNGDMVEHGTPLLDIAPEVTS